MLLRARVVVPVATPPVDNGAVLISGRRIRAVGSWRQLAGQSRNVVDLGEVALFPGLINAHCHLDYTGMAGRLRRPRRFTDWIRQITEAKAGWTRADFVDSWRLGAGMLIRTGTTTVGDTEAMFDLLPEAWNATSLRVFSFLEMTGIRSRQAPSAVLQEAIDRIAMLKHRRCRAWLSPHAPYSTLPELLKQATRVSRRRRWRVSTHVAESDQEFDMFAHARGDMHGWLECHERNNADCGLGSPVQHMERSGALTSSLLAIHANCLAPGDAALLARRGVHVVHCPRSHAYFRHPAFRFDELTAAGVNISLATDSLASVVKCPGRQPELNLFEEMQEFSRNFPRVKPEDILRMVTMNPARALGMAGRLGELSRGALGDLVAVPFEGPKTAVFESLVHHAGAVRASLIDGVWAVPPPG
jgi:cytosine/adenosine deaminase-related metal-dependent hydrolase